MGLLMNKRRGLILQAVILLSLLLAPPWAAKSQEKESGQWIKGKLIKAVNFRQKPSLESYVWDEDGDRVKNIIATLDKGQVVMVDTTTERNGFFKARVDFEEGSEEGWMAKDYVGFSSPTPRWYFMLGGALIILFIIILLGKFRRKSRPLSPFEFAPPQQLSTARATGVRILFYLQSFVFTIYTIVKLIPRAQDFVQSVINLSSNGLEIIFWTFFIVLGLSTVLLGFDAGLRAHKINVFWACVAAGVYGLMIGLNIVSLSSAVNYYKYLIIFFVAPLSALGALAALDINLIDIKAELKEKTQSEKAKVIKYMVVLSIIIFAVLVGVGLYGQVSFDDFKTGVFITKLSPTMKFTLPVVSLFGVGTILLLGLLGGTLERAAVVSLYGAGLIAFPSVVVPVLKEMYSYYFLLNTFLLFTQLFLTNIIAVSLVGIIWVEAKEAGGEVM